MDDDRFPACASPPVQARSRLASVRSRASASETRGTTFLRCGMADMNGRAGRDACFTGRGSRPNIVGLHPNPYTS